MRQQLVFDYAANPGGNIYLSLAFKCNHQRREFGDADGNCHLIGKSGYGWLGYIFERVHKPFIADVECVRPGKLVKHFVRCGLL